MRCCALGVAWFWCFFVLLSVVCAVFYSAHILIQHYCFLSIYEYFSEDSILLRIFVENSGLFAVVLDS